MTVRLPTDLERELTELARGRLQPREDIREPNWRFWERRTLNIHRVVAQCTYGARSARELESLARDTIALHFRTAWWRGLGFGVVAEVRDAAGYPGEFMPLLDTRANPKGTWQWLILVSRSTGHAWGLHVWVEGYLSPVYRGLLGRLGEQGFQVQSARQEKDGLMKLLTAVRPGVLPEFEEGPRPDRRPSRL